MYFLNIYFSAPGLVCGMWDLVSWPGVEPRPVALGEENIFFPNFYLVVSSEYAN